MTKVSIWRIAICVLALLQSVGAANILYVSIFPSRSHYQMLEPLMLKLAERGHNVTVLSHFPQKKTVPNYRDISLRGTASFYVLDFASWPLTSDITELFTSGSQLCADVLSSPAVQGFLREGGTFHLIFLEMFHTECILGFPIKFSAPYVLVSSLPLPVWHGDWLGNPTEGSYVPSPMCRLGPRMGLLERTKNFLCLNFLRIFNYVYSTRKSVESVRRNFHVDIDSLEELKRNVSLMISNSHPAVTGVRSFFPNIVELAGMHVRETKPLPGAMDLFLNGATDGAVVFSMGSIVQVHTLAPALRESFMEIFGKLKQRVLWKWEKTADTVPDNVMLIDWMPQSDVLAHKNVRLFIYHGGIHGVIEAVYHGVPILGIPLFGDQHGNIKQLVSAGAAMELDVDSMTPELFSAALSEMLNNEEYANNMKRLSSAMRDSPMSPLGQGVYWTEYILRHGGGSPMKFVASNLHWFQYHLIDVFVTCAFSCALIVLFGRFFLKFLRII